MRRFSKVLLPVVLAMVCMPPSAARAQSLAAPGPAPTAPGFGSEVHVRVDGPFYTAPVALDGSLLFRIAAPLNAASTALPISVRDEFVRSALAQIIAERENGKGTIYDPDRLKIALERDRDLYYLVASDRMHATRLPILTVTSADAGYNHQPVDALAAQWQQTLQSALVTALKKRQPQVIRRNIALLAYVGAALIVLTGAAMLLLTSLRKRIDELYRLMIERRESVDQAQRQSEDADVPGERHRRRVLALALRAAAPEQRWRQARAVAAFVVWLLVLMWTIGIWWALLLFPQTTPYGTLIARSATRVAFIWIVAGLVNRLGDIAIARVAKLFTTQRTLDDGSQERARSALRVPTISRALSGFKTFIVLFVAALSTLGVFHVPIASVVTIGGVAALAVGFAAQSLVRDFLNGLLVLIEDQYAVGDYVMIGGFQGVVENLSLRVVQMRDESGNLVTVPHSAVTQVVNASRHWSRVIFRVAIDPSADITKAIAVVRATIEALAKEAPWASYVREAVEWIGVEHLSKSGIILRAAVRTVPLRQFEVGRELNERVHEALQSNDIALGTES